MQAARGASLNNRDQPRSQDTPQRRRHHLLIFATIALVAYVVDVVTKIVAVEKLTDRAPVELVGHYFSLYLARNPGAAFSTGTEYTAVLSVIALVAAGAVVWFSRRLGSTGWAIGLGFLLAGVLGNLTDRVFRTPGFMRGHVVDFFMFPNFPVFNVADVCINIAAGTIIIQAFRGVALNGDLHQKVEEPDSVGDEEPGSTPS